MDQSQKSLYRDVEESRQNIDYELDKAAEYYGMITHVRQERRDPRIEAVAWHGTAKLTYLRLKYEKVFQSNQERPFPLSGRLEDVRRCYEESVAISKERGFEYAPPMNGMAWTFWREYREKWSEHPSDKSERLKLLEDCLKWSERAIQASGETYAPPMLLQAAAAHQFGVESGPEADRDKTRALIVRAFALSPYGSMVHGDLESFSTLLFAEAGRDPSKLAFYRTVRFAQPASSTTESLNTYLTRQSDSVSADDHDQLLILRRWSSYTPLIRTREHRTVGGGYLLVWNSTVIAIDPGVGFVRNLHRYDYFVEDLDGIVMTHQHIDHVDDAEAILSIMKTCAADARVARGKGLPKFVLSKSGVERWERMIVSALELEDSSSCIEELSSDVATRRKADIGGVEVNPIPLYGHTDAIDEGTEQGTNGESGRKGARRPTGFGLVLKGRRDSGEELNIGITSDTGYLAQDSSDKSEPAKISKHYIECDVVVLHLSTVADLEDKNVLRHNEEERRKSGKDSKFVQYDCDWAASLGYPGLLYKKHLGFWGVVLFIRDLIEAGDRVRTVVLSEFGEETLTSRVAILNEVCSLIGTLGDAGEEQAKRIYLGDVGTQILLPSGSISCSFGLNRCPKDADRFLEFDTGSGDLTTPHRGWSDRSIAHFCEAHDFLVGRPRALNTAIWGYSGQVVVNDEFREARYRDTEEVHPSFGNWWLLDE